MPEQDVADSTNDDRPSLNAPNPNALNPATRHAILKTPILLSILAAVLTLGIKCAAYGLSDSVGLLSEAFEALLDLQASVVALICLWYASLPVDKTHTYGHDKIEYFSSGLEGMLILVAAAGIGWCAVQRLIAPQKIEPFGWGIVLAIVAAVINLIVGQVLLRVGRTHGSIILEADGQHLMTDVWTTAGVVAGLTFIKLFPEVANRRCPAGPGGGGEHRVDRLRAFAPFFQRSDGPRDSQGRAGSHTRFRGRGFAGRHALHALRTRQAGTHRFADFHLLVPGAWSVKQAHNLVAQIEAAVHAALPALEVTIHIEPIEEPVCWEDSALLAVEGE